MTWLLAFLFSIAALQSPPHVETRDGKIAITNAPRASTMARNVLIIGNSLSYFNEMPWMLEQVARSKSAKPPLHVEFSGGSGMTLAQHWKAGKALLRINDGRWDFVVLQAQSTEAVREPPNFEEYAQRFDTVIRTRHGRTVILGTWAPRHSGYTQRSFDEEYEKTAKRLGAIFAPVGPAWAALEGRGVELFEDDVHPNVAGSYLAACVLYALVYGESPNGATHTFDVHFDVEEWYRRSLEHARIDDGKANLIQASAWAAVQAQRAR